MYMYSCSTHEGLHNLIFCLLKIFIFWKTVIFNGFLYEEDTNFHCFLQAQNIWQIFFFSYDEKSIFPKLCSVWPKHCLNTLGWHKRGPNWIGLPCSQTLVISAFRNTACRAHTAATTLVVRDFRYMSLAPGLR